MLETLLFSVLMQGKSKHDTSHWNVVIAEVAGVLNQHPAIAVICSE